MSANFMPVCVATAITGAALLGTSSWIHAADGPAVGADARDVETAEGEVIILFSTNFTQFQSDLAPNAKQEKGIENFEDADFPTNGGIGMNDPIHIHTNNSALDPGDIIAGIRIQSNTNDTVEINDPGTAGIFPWGSSGLAGLGAGANGGDISNKCVTPAAHGFSRESLDIINTDERVSAMWLLVGNCSLTLPKPIEIRVYDQQGTFMGVTTTLGGAPGGDFVGIVLANGGSIGRVNIWNEGFSDNNGKGECLYEFGLYWACPWDINGTGGVDTADLLAMLAEWGPNLGHEADLNLDGVIDTADLLELLSGWGGCP